jgi:hypothetical protein
MATFLLCLGVTAGASAAPIDCGPAPDVKCLAAEIFALAKTLPDDSYFRRHVAFAEQELAPGDIKTALEYVVSDNPDPLSWEDIEWMARAGRFDPAIKQARQRKSLVERLGGLLAVAAHVLDKNDKARAQKIVEDVERQLPSIAGDTDDTAGLLPETVGELWVRLGQTDRGARLINDVGMLLSLARKFPAAASLREQAWREAERLNEPYFWLLLVEDAISRGDQAAASRAGQHATHLVDGHDAYSMISLAGVLLRAGLPDQAGKLIEPWPQWLKGADAMSQWNTVSALIPVLAGLGRDQDLQMAVRAVDNPYRRSQCLGTAAAEYFRLGRSVIAEKLDVEALALAITLPTAEPELRRDRNAALHNLALNRATRGDLQSVLAVVLDDETKIVNVTSGAVRRAIETRHESAVAPAIETLQQFAIRTRDARLLLQAAEDWYSAGNEDKARDCLSEAMRIADAQHTPFPHDAFGRTAELTWQLDGEGKPESLIVIVDQLGVNDPFAIDSLVGFIRPISPAVAVQLTSRQTEVHRRITELVNIATQVAASSK